MKNLYRIAVFASVALALFGYSTPGFTQDEPHAIVLKSRWHASAPPLSQLIPVPANSARMHSGEDEEEDERPLPHGIRTTPVADAALQAPDDASTATSLAALSPNSGLNILGLGTGFSGYSLQANVPDTNAAVGPTQVVEYVNEAFVVLNKSTGSVEYGPANGNTLWQSLGGPCATYDNLDPIVQFDKLAQRWVMMMPIFHEPSYFCVAVSSSSDAVNSSWNLYAFEEPGGNPLCGGCRPDPDYPKWGVWPDGYYLSYVQGGVNEIYIGAGVCVVDRNDMLKGASAANMQCFTQTGTNYGAMLPADVDGTTAPPSGSPEYFLAYDYNDQSLDLWQFHVNWTTPSLSTFTGPTNIPVAAFTEPCGETQTEVTYTTGACIPQAGTSEELDSYGDRLMYRLAYRNFGSYASLLANHTVNIGNGTPQTGVRWYELRNSGSGFSLHQQGTYAPDSNYRWMGSIAMDKVGDVALGYSVSSSSMHPSIRYTGRLSTDSLGQMDSETDILSQAGVALGSQTNTYRWGDYGSMAIDSSDDCTFWFATEYVPSSSSPNNHWATRIASFNFPACTGATNTAWSIVSKASNWGSPLTSLAVSSTGAGHLIAIALMFNGSTSVSSIADNAGNSYLSAGARSTTGALSLEIWYAVNSKSGATTITPKFAGSPGHVEMTEWEVSGIATGSPDAINTAAGAVTSSNTAGPAVTTSEAGDFVISALFANSADFTAISSGNAFTDDFTTFGNGWAHLTSNSASAGSYQASWYTPSPVGVYCASTVAFRP